MEPLPCTRHCAGQHGGLSSCFCLRADVWRLYNKQQLVLPTEEVKGQCQEKEVFESDEELAKMVRERRTLSVQGPGPIGSWGERIM